GRKLIKLNVRVIATSNRDLKQAVANGDFREDLFYRLNVFPLTWLPLCKRANDILPLSEHIINLHSPSERVSLTASAENKLLSYSWPGNVRELDNVIQRALIMKSGTDIDSDDLLIEDFIIEKPTQTIEISHDEENLESELKQQEFQIILDALRACNGSRKDVAERLGISARTLRYKLAKMRENGIQLPV
ncbi:MAG: helix-turn-helix domain-containing protein, partial [Thalassotalea sp.]|nr:helix-turn-helix domain-containing protein [Thalassotalea sp.]